jgi:hypothetical protein
MQNQTPTLHVVVELQLAPNNKDIFNVEYIQEYKIKLEPPRYNRDIAQCVNCQRYGHAKNYCHLKPRCVKCAGEHLTNQCQKKKDRAMSHVSSVVNHPANYKGCTVYKDLEKKTYPPLRSKIYTPPAQMKQTMSTESGVSCSCN